METAPWMRVMSLVSLDMRMPVGVLVKKEREKYWR